MKKILITAHSGCENTKANSIDFLKKAVEVSANILEVDTRICKDREVVLFHDEKILKSSNLVKIEDLNYCEIKKVDDEIITLNDALAIIKHSNIHINLDFKTTKAVDKAITILKDHKMIDRASASGCNKSMLREVQDFTKTIPFVLNTDNYLSYHQDFAVKKLIKNALTLGAQGLNVNYKYVTESLIYEASLRNLPVFAWTIDDRESLLNAIRISPHSITTNKVCLLKELMQNNHI